MKKKLLGMLTGMFLMCPMTALAAPQSVAVDGAGHEIEITAEVIEEATEENMVFYEEGENSGVISDIQWTEEVGRFSYKVHKSGQVVCGYITPDGEKIGYSRSSCSVKDSSQIYISTCDLNSSLSYHKSGMYTPIVKWTPDDSDSNPWSMETGELYIGEPKYIEISDKSLETPSNLHWDGTKACWDLVDNSKKYVFFLYKTDGITRPIYVRGIGATASETSYGEYAMVIEGNTVKYNCQKDLVDTSEYSYYFTVRAETTNVSMFKDSKESDKSPYYGNVVTGDKTVQEKIDTVLDSSASTDEKLATLKKMEPNDLKVALQDTNGAGKKITDFEDTYKAENDIKVSSTSTSDAIPSEGIKIDGAALNASKKGASVELKVSTPTPENKEMIDKAIDTDVFKSVVAFNMDLEGVNSSTSLEVPVRITLPIPAGMMKENLKIVHFRVDGKYDVITPAFSGDMAIFVIDHFSPFAFANEVPKGEDPETKDLDCKWYIKDGKSYWYEKGVRQGTYDDAHGVMGDGTIRGREIFDPESSGWYWLDAKYDGAKAVNKEVWMPYIYQIEASWDEEEIWANAKNSGSMAQQVHDAILLNGKIGGGKWVRYDANGAMIKGWYTVTEAEVATNEKYRDQLGNTYYYDNMTGLMAKGWTEIDGVNYHFDETTGALIK